MYFGFVLNQLISSMGIRGLFYIFLLGKIFLERWITEIFLRKFGAHIAQLDSVGHGGLKAGLFLFWGGWVLSVTL